MLSGGPLYPKYKYSYILISLSTLTTKHKRESLSQGKVYAAEMVGGQPVWHCTNASCSRRGRRAPPVTEVERTLFLTANELLLKGCYFRALNLTKRTTIMSIVCNAPHLGWVKMGQGPYNCGWPLQVERFESALCVQ